jgi:hypothetical protein
MEHPDDQGKNLANLFDLAVEVNKIDQDSSLEQFFDAAEKLDALPFDSNGIIRRGALAVLDAIDMSSWRCPEVAEDLKLGMQIFLLALVEFGLETHPDGIPQEDLAKQAQRQAEALAKVMQSQAARRSANARHKPTNQQKAIALAEWDAYGAGVSSMAAFARARRNDFGVAERTLYGWIRDHCKEKT